MPSPTNVSEAGQTSDPIRIPGCKLGDDELNRLVMRAASLCQTPMAAITLIDSSKVYFQAAVRFDHAPIDRSNSLFDLTIQQNGLFVIKDTLEHAQLRSAVLVADSPYIRAYAGIPLIASGGFCIGTISVMDIKARDLAGLAKSHLYKLAELTVESLERAQSAVELNQTVDGQTETHLSLPESDQFAHATSDTLFNAIAVLDEAGVILAANKAWRHFSHASGLHIPSLEIGANYMEACRVASKNGLYEATATVQGIESIFAGDSESFTIEYPRHEPGQKRWFLVQGSRFLTKDNACVVIAYQNITAKKIAELKLKDQAQHDGLTRLVNRSRFQKILDECFDAYKNGSGEPFCVLFLDLDRFKLINDSLGHSLGDKLLASVAKDLHATIRQWQFIYNNARHCIARLGGDEFGILIKDIDDTDTVVTLAKRILQKIGVHRMIAGYEVFASGSIGIAWAESDDQFAEDVLRRADTAMYEAKVAGKNRVGVFDQSMHERISRIRSMEVDLRHALDRGEFFLVYQPVVCLRTGLLSGFEALIRWNRPGFGLISPHEFISLTEETGLIENIGHWVTMTACKQLAEWHAFQKKGNLLTMNVNLSRKQLTDPHLVESIRNVIDASKIPPETLRFEVTESAIVELTDTIEKLKSIKQLGVLLYIDDFGTGHSSLTCLHKFPVDGLKIDRSFVQHATGRRDMASLIQAVVTLGANLGLGVVAEGLETADQVAMLQSMDCAFGQGYFFSRPMTSEQAFAFIQRSERDQLFPADPDYDV